MLTCLEMLDSCQGVGATLSEEDWHCVLWELHRFKFRPVITRPLFERELPILPTPTMLVITPVYWFGGVGMSDVSPVAFADYVGQLRPIPPAYVGGAADHDAPRRKPQDAPRWMKRRRNSWS